jgi:hypothetical protein
MNACLNNIVGREFASRENIDNTITVAGSQKIVSAYTILVLFFVPNFSWLSNNNFLG